MATTTVGDEVGVALAGGGEGALELQLLGGFELRVGGEPVVVQPAAQRLLALLALTGTALDRAFVAFQLWPDTAEERAKANLRSTVWRLRRERGDVVAATKTQLRLARHVRVDVVDGDGGGDGDGDGGVPSRPHAVTALGGELLPDWYDDWLVTERERLRQRGLHRLERRAEAHLDAGRTDEAIQLGLRASALEPLRESPHRLVIRCHLAEGNLVEAVRQYERYASLVLRELGAPVSDHLKALLPQVSAGARASA